MPLRTFFRLNKIKYDLEKNNLEINFEKIEEIKTTIDQMELKWHNSTIEFITIAKLIQRKVFWYRLNPKKR